LIKELRTKRSKLLFDMNTLALQGTRTEEARAKFAKMNSEVYDLDNNINSLEARAASATAGARAASNDSNFQRSPRPGIGEIHNGGNTEERKKKFSKAFQQYALRGSIHNVDPEYRDLLTTSTATGGALVPQIFSGILADALKFYGPIAQKVRQKVTENNGAPIKISLDNDTQNGLTLLATEGTSSPAETDPTFTSALLGVDTVTGGLVKVSFQELEDSAFDLDSFIRDKFSLRYGRGLEKAVTLGTDSAGTTLPNQTSGGILGAATAGTTTASLAAGIGWDDLTAAYGALDPAYVNPNTAWVFNSTTRATLLGMKDGFGRPFWIPDPSADGPFDKLMGYDVVIDQSMPNLGANAKPILFGDLSRAYLLRTDGDPSILRLNERYADTLEVGFFLYARIGGVSLNAGTSPLVYIQQAAS
jgi:HK97 family phage major capsid protein